VRVWLADLDAPPLPAAALAAALSAEESARMARFAFPALRTRFAAGRGMLRAALGAALGVAPREVPLVDGPNGRPALAPARRGGARVAFNVSHSGALVAIALGVAEAADAAPLAVGVDLEHVVDVPEMEGVAERVFDEAERAVLAGREGGERLATFHRLWTRKEACMKATGAGFTLPPHTFHVDADEPVQRVRLPAHECAPEGATLVVHDIVAAGARCAGAVAVGDGTRRVDVVRLGPPSGGGPPDAP
jgi:4'-phosphopantetheinyl transferase